MAIPFLEPPPNTTPVDGEISGNGKTKFYFSASTAWGKWLDRLYEVIASLVGMPSDLIGTHAERLATDPANYPEGSTFYERDRTTRYENVYATPGDRTTASWTNPQGEMVVTIFSPDTRPADLGVSDTGFTIFAKTRYNHRWLWDGSAWQRAPGDYGRYPQFFEHLPTTPGFVNCDGTVQRVSNDDATTTTITVPLIPYLAATGHYTHLVAGIAVGVLTAPVPPTISGETGSAGAHDHTYSFTTSSAGAHTHTGSGTTSSSGAHTHSVAVSFSDSFTTSSAGAHTHTGSGTTSSDGAHDHTGSGTTSNDGTHAHSFTNVTELDGAHTHGVSTTDTIDSVTVSVTGHAGVAVAGSCSVTLSGCDTAIYVPDYDQVQVASCGSTAYGDFSGSGEGDVTGSGTGTGTGTGTGSTTEDGLHSHNYYGDTLDAGDHDHTYSFTTSSDGAHTHTYSFTTSSSGAHTHSVAVSFSDSFTTSSSGAHTHTYSFTTSSDGTHTHDGSGTTSNDGAHVHDYGSLANSDNFDVQHVQFYVQFRL